MTLLVSKFLYLVVGFNFLHGCVKSLFWNEKKEIEWRKKVAGIGFQKNFRKMSFGFIFWSLIIIFLTAQFKLGFIWYFISAFVISMGLITFAVSFLDSVKNSQTKAEKLVDAPIKENRIRNRKLSSILGLVLLIAWIYSGYENVI